MMYSGSKTFLVRETGATKVRLKFPGRGGGNSYVKRTGVLVVPFRGQKVVLVPLRVFSLKRSTAGALEVPFRVLSRKIDRNWALTFCFV